MQSYISNCDRLRLPKLDEYGHMLLENVARRTRVKKESATTMVIETAPGLGGSGVLFGSDGSSDDFGLSRKLPDSPDEWQMHIAQQPFVELMSYFSGREPEAAGVLFGPVDDAPLITRFIPDHLGRGTPVAFELHTPSLNQMLQQMKTTGLTCKGIVHSHPRGVTQPSGGDLYYFRSLFGRPANADTTHVFVPIICGGRLYPYVFTEDGITRASLVVV